ncbi:MAG: NADH-quinone oxidoreductase subunit NuoH [Elusimicrobia bacterium]|nr:NADH-quinone oxidoreductase subunit NuoH [Elusimicrobiota bacterium]
MILPVWNESQKRSALILFGIASAGAGISIAIGEIGARFSKIWQCLSSFALKNSIPTALLTTLSMIIQCSILIGFISGAVMFMVWWERKVSAHMQNRLGPMFTGGWHGWAQTIADAIKLLLKEDIIPAEAKPWVHRLAPIVAFVPAFLCYAALPFGEGLISADLDIGILYIFAISGLSVLGIVMAGWGSGNKYSLLGGLRSAAQSVSYEIPRVLSVVPILMMVGSLKLTSIANVQTGFWRLAGIPLLPRWFIFYPIVGQIAFLIFLISSVAETNRTPFDIAEAESELVAGFHTEYSGMKFSFFFLAEYAYVFLSSGLTTVLFLGGGSGPVLPSWSWFLLKSFAVVFLFLWFRWTFPRLRVDRLMEFTWKFLLPWSFINILITGFILLF